jgi:hypothetical protein
MTCGCEKEGGAGRHWAHHGGSCCCDCGCRHGNRCSCGSHFHAGPAFWTREEKLAWLQSRLEELQERAQTIQERIAALKAEG